MFGLQGGERVDTIARKRGYMKEARQQWHLLTNFDLWWIKTKQQLCLMVQTRSGISEEQAKQEVDAWMEGNSSELLPPSLAPKGERHMTATSHGKAAPTGGENADEEMAKYGITRVSIDYFHFKEYRYTTLDDAIAQAKRQQPAVPSDGREQSGLR